MKKLLLFLVHMKGSWTPGFILRFLGKRHQKNGMVENRGTDFKMAKSPLLLRTRHNYEEYVKKIDMRSNNILSMLNSRLLKERAKREIIEDKLKFTCEKLDYLSAAKDTGNVIRLRESLQDRKQELIEQLSEYNSIVSSIENKISEIQEYADFCKSKTSYKAISKAYSYIEGCQAALKSSGHYLKQDDYSSELFQFMTTSKVAEV